MSNDDEIHDVMKICCSNKVSLYCVIPKSICTKLGIHKGTLMSVRLAPDGTIQLKKYGEVSCVQPSPHQKPHQTSDPVKKDPEKSFLQRMGILP